MSLAVVLSSLVSLAFLEPADAPVSGQEDCQVRVEGSFAAGRNAEATAVAERCWEEQLDPIFLFYAAQARINLKHGAHAAAYLRRYERAGGTLKVEDFATSVRGMVVSVEVSVTPTPTIEGEIAAAYLGETNRGVIRISSAELRERESQVLLDRGRWRLAWRERGSTVVTKEIEAREGLRVVLEIPQMTSDVLVPSLQPPGGDDETVALQRRQRRARVGVAAGLGSAGALSLGVGIGLLTYGGSIDVGQLKSGASYEESAAHYGPVVNRGYYTWNGSVTLGAGLGAGAVIITELAKTRRAALYSELGAGAALVIAGGAWSAVMVGGYEDITQDYYDHGEAPGNDVFTGLYRGGIGSGLLLGLGSGLVTGAAIALISRAVAERRRR